MGRPTTSPSLDARLPAHLLRLGERGVYSTKNRLNDLTGKEWVFATKSVINKAYPPSFQQRLRSLHGGQKPPELCRDLIMAFTKEGQRVLDPFAGVGGTLIGASISGRAALGIEIEPRWAEIYRQVCQIENLCEQPLLVGDSRTLLPDLPDEGFDMVLTDVPFWTMDVVKRSTGKYKCAGEPAVEARGTKLGPFGAARPADKGAWLRDMGDIFGLCCAKLKRKGYLLTFIGDMYNNGRYHFLSADLATVLAGLGLTMKANLVWYDVTKKLHVYGYLYEFIPSMIHQNILVFRKP